MGQSLDPPLPRTDQADAPFTPRPMDVKAAYQGYDWALRTGCGRQKPTVRQYVNTGHLYIRTVHANTEVRGVVARCARVGKNDVLLEKVGALSEGEVNVVLPMLNGAED